jgi:glutamyl-tRNA synthetase
MFNFLALLGWSPGQGDRELFTREELVQAFTLDGIASSNAVFNPEKLDWFNGEHIARMPERELAARLEPLLREAGLWRQEYAGTLADWLDAVIALLKPRARKLEDFVARGRPFFSEHVEYDPAAVQKHLSNDTIGARMEALRAALAAAEPFDASTTEATLRRVASEQGTGAGPLIHATRVAVTGAAVSPGLFEVLALLGRERTLARIDSVQQFLRRKP